MSLEAVIRAQHISKRYGRQVALNDVSLEVPSGVVFGLLGENGAGKSTLIRILLGLTRADAGTSQVLGNDSARQAYDIRRQVGYVAERPALYDWMTVAETGWFAAGFYDESFLPRYQQLTQQFHLRPDARLKQLSKGMRAKVSLALAMAHDPQLLILDEPTSGLDTLVRREFLESMVELTATGRTVFLSSHQINEVERVADIVAMVRDGQILVVEALDELKRTSALMTVVLDDASRPFELPGRVVESRRDGRRLTVLLRGEADREAHLMRQLPGVESVTPETPTLEEIFVAYMRGTAVGPASMDEAMTEAPVR